MAHLASRTGSAATHSVTAEEWCSAACAAIETGRCLEIQYESFTRLIEVHRVGISPGGDHILSGWQVRGPAHERAGWKLLDRDDAVGMTVTDLPSRAPRPDYRRGAKQFIGIICQL